jgi:hypothetical protein
VFGVFNVTPSVKMKRNDVHFRPNLSPKECIQAGIFGGIYFNPRGGRPGILSPSVNISHKEFPADWFEGLSPNAYRGKVYDKSANMYGVNSGKNQAYWESMGWIHPADPRGWFQWYCRYYQGRRMEDDDRQIRRWNGVAGPDGRWKVALMKRIIAKSDNGMTLKRAVDDYSVSPKIRQLLLHWGVRVHLKDVRAFMKRRS